MSVCYSKSIEHVKCHGYSLTDFTVDAKETFKTVKTVKKYRFLDISKFINDGRIEIWHFDAVESPERPLSEGIPAQAQPYAALSYPWKDLPLRPEDPKPEYPKSENPNCLPDSFMHQNLPKEPPTSIPVLMAVCKAAEKRSCKYLWMDKLCKRQDDDNKDGKEDSVWQMKRMYGLYEKCKVCLVAAGGMVRLPSLCEKTTWIDRAWTLQEALAPPEVMCLFLWGFKHDVIQENHTGVVKLGVEKVSSNVAMTTLFHLLATNLHADEPKMVDGKDHKDNTIKVAVLPDDKDSQVWIFGNRKADDWPIVALQNALDQKPTAGEPISESVLSARRLSIWRCITMRSASHVEDFVFATMGIFDVIVPPLEDPKTKQPRDPYYPEDEVQELLHNYLKELEKKGSRADWFAVAPELGPPRETTALPLVPDINYPTKDKKGNTVSTAVKNLLGSKSDSGESDISNDCQNVYGRDIYWYLDDALKYTVDAPNGIKVTGPAHAIVLADEMLPKDPQRLSFVRIHDGSKFEVTDRGDGSLYAIVMGKQTQYSVGTRPTMVDNRVPVLLMLVKYIPFTAQRFRNTGYAWTHKKFTDSWSEMTIGIGLQGG